MSVPGPKLRSLYISYLGLDDPLVWTQVIAYLEGLTAAGHTIHLLTFDGPHDDAQRRSWERGLADRGITWHSCRYHKRPSVPATVFDALVGAVTAAHLVRRHRLDVVHARNHVPAASGLIASRLSGCGLIFDLRGLMADEYADAGRWKKGGFPYRLTEWIQRSAIRRCSGMVCLTDAVRRHLLEEDRRSVAQVIPCCADLERIAAQAVRGDAVREGLELGERPVMVYVGKLGGRYMDRATVDFFKAAQQQIDGLALLILTQASPEPILDALARSGIAASDFRIARSAPQEVGAYLAAADFGVCFYHRRFSEIAASPTKVGEYLGAGIPVVLSSGVGDFDELLRTEDVGVVAETDSEAAQQSALSALLGLLADPDTPQRCRRVAQQRLSLAEVGIPSYDALYRRLSERR